MAPKAIAALAAAAALGTGAGTAQAASWTGPPLPPALAAPAPGATEVSRTPVLDWEPAGGAKTYDVEVARAPAAVRSDGSFAAPVARRTGLTATAWAVGSPLEAAAEHEWHVLARNRAGARWSASSSFHTVAAGFTFARRTDPARTEVYESGQLAATFTDGSYTVTLRGPARTFSESTTSYSVTTSAWVRVLPQPFSGTVDTGWLAAALGDRSPDVIATAMEFTTGAPLDASYGPLQADGTRQEGSDFNDYLGVPWTYPDGLVDQPEAAQIGSLDCSGYMRMVWGYRSGLPLVRAPDGSGLPRRAVEQAASAPGVVTVPNSGLQVTDFSRLSAGDLVFFDASADDGAAVDHVGMYLGVDSGGNRRFVSSRKSIDGPTLGDYRGRSTLNGTGLYATSFRAVRRL